MSGTLSGAQICEINGQPAPFEVYTDPIRGTPRVRRISPNAPVLNLVDAGKRKHPVNAGQGQVFNPGQMDTFEIGGKEYKLAGNKFVPI
jgi:hypothetical protein